MTSCDVFDVSAVVLWQDGVLVSSDKVFVISYCSCYHSNCCAFFFPVTKSASEPVLKTLVPDMTNDDMDEETLKRNREKFMMNRQKKPKGSPSGASRY